MASTDKEGTPIIALRFFETGGRSFGPCDRFPRNEFPDLTDRRFMQMTESRHLAPLSRDSYERGLRSREDGYIGKGFTAEGLIAMGVIDAAPKTAKKAAAPAAPATPAASPPPPAPTKPLVTPPQAIVDAGYDVVEFYAGYWLAGAKRGVSTRFDIFDDAGNRLNPGRTENGLKQAKAEADKFRAVADAEAAKAAAAAPPVVDPEKVECAAPPEGEETKPEDDAAGGAGGTETSTETDKPHGDPSAERPDLDAMATEALADLLTKHGLSPDDPTDRTTLLAMAKMLEVSTETDASDKPDAEEQKDGTDGGDIRSSTGDSEGSGPPEDR